MKNVWLAADCVVSPLGITTVENFENIIAGRTGVRRIDDAQYSASPFCGSKMEIIAQDDLTEAEIIVIEAIQGVLKSVPVPLDRTIFILSTTKGNIGFLEKGDPSNPRLDLHAMAAFISDKFGFKKHLVVSNACISGVMALTVGKRLIEAGEADHVLVAGVDVLTKFVVSGFQSLHALSEEACRPFDADRKGINLGEAAAAILMTGKPDDLSVVPTIRFAGTGLSNDANHISGPSRTGVELADAVSQALQEAGIGGEQIDFISAHGTGTPYNDEMEAKAFSLLNLDTTPVHSMKGYFGHTLGAAGVVEVAISAASLRNNQLIASKGYHNSGVSRPLAVITEAVHANLTTCLKTASGFGGCNAALVLVKENNN